MIKDTHIHEECGVFGAAGQIQDLAALVCSGLYALQHRGQESAGIAVNDDGVFSVHKGEGLVSEVFTDETLKELGQGNIAVGHVRYATTGADNLRNVQPLVINHHKGRMVLAHNGNLTNAYELRKAQEEGGAIFHSTSDTEVIAYTIVQQRLHRESIEAAVSAAMDIVEGAYSLVISSPAKLIAARDPHGLRPLCYGRRADGTIIFASESCALDAVGAELIRDLLPGEIAVTDGREIWFDTSHCGKAKRSFCVFEYIYFARPDSVIDGCSVSLARQRAGAFLAQEHPVEADLVIGVPDSGLEAALGYAGESGIPFALGFTKNKYIGRTFIAPDQALREQGVNIKLNPIRSVIAEKRIVLVDDSVVRGTTSRRIADLLRTAGAREVHLRVSAPAFIRPCYYGTDVDDAEGLIANEHSTDEIAGILGVDSIGYLSLEHVKLLTGCDSGFCSACFDGDYPAGVPTHVGKDRFEIKIGKG